MVSQRTYNIPAARAIKFGILFIGISLFACYQCMYVRWPSKQNPFDWHSAECTITKIEVGDTVERIRKDKKYVYSSINVFFEYEFNGKTYTYNNIISSHSTNSSKYFALYQPGDKSVCYIDPSDFKKARFHKKITGKDLLDYSITPAVSGSFGLCFIIYGIIRLRTDT